MIFAAICKRAAVVRRPSSAISRVFGVFRGLTAVFNRRYLRSFVAQPAQILSALFNLCNSFNPFNNLAAASPRCVHSPRWRAVAAGLSFLPIYFGFRASDFGFPALPGCGFVLTTALRISCVDTPGEAKRGSGSPAGSISGCGEPFYGTMSGPWWYHTATSVPRVPNPPFSLLRTLILTRRLVWS